jgi:hypothetical protein
MRAAINPKLVKRLVFWLVQIISWLQQVRFRKPHVHLVMVSQTLAQHLVTRSRLQGIQLQLQGIQLQLFVQL